MPRRKQLDPLIVQAALAGLEARRVRVEEQIATVRGLLGGQRTAPRAAAGANEAPSVAPARKKRRTMSAAARKRIALAAKRRWAEWRKKQAAKRK